MQKFNLIKYGLNKLSLTLIWLLLCFMPTAYCAPKTILVLGDSLSAEYGLARGDGWVSLLDKRLQEKKIPAQIINASISGDTTSQALARLPDLLKKHAPHIVIIELGGNDGLRGLSLASSEKNFHAIISACRLTKANVLLLGMQIPPNYGRTYTEQFSAMYASIAKESKVPLVPFFLDGVAQKEELFQADHIHLTAAAHPRMLDNVWPYLLPLLSTKK